MRICSCVRLACCVLLLCCAARLVVSRWDRFAVAAMMASTGVTEGLVTYLCLKKTVAEMQGHDVRRDVHVSICEDNCWIDVGD